LSDLMTLFIDLECLYCKQTQRAFSKNTLNWLKIDSADQKLFKIQLTRVWELVTKHWNAWHWERHCVFTAGGERVRMHQHQTPTKISWIRWKNKRWKKVHSPFLKYDE
jgi:hypothetical protein